MCFIEFYRDLSVNYTAVSASLQWAFRLENNRVFIITGALSNGCYSSPSSPHL